MHTLFETESERFAGLVEMVRRRAPFFMRAGGGSLTKERIANITERQRLKIVELRQRGWLYREIAAHLGCGEDTVARWVRASGAPVKSYRRLTPLQVERLTALRAEGWTCKRIANDLGCTVWTVLKRLSAERIREPKQRRAA